MFINQTGIAVNVYAPIEFEGVRYADLTDPIIRQQVGVIEIDDPIVPSDYSEDTYFRTEQQTAPYIIYTKKSEDMLEALRKQKVIQQIIVLESSVTIRRLTEAVLTDAGKQWIQDVKTQIDTLRATI